MTAARHSRLLQFSGLILCALVWLANDSNPPTGNTGASFDGHCNDCHDGNNPGGFDGDVTINGLPGTIEANTTYPLSITMNVTAGSPTKGGFQIVAVDGSNFNAGDFMNSSGQTGTENFQSREYLEHRNGKLFSGGTATWNFEWKSPAGGVSGNNISFYYIGNFTNNNGQDSGDFPKAFSQSVAYNGPPPVTATITGSTNVSCFGGNDGTATVEGGGGVAPYSYLWSNGQTTQTATNLSVNTYTVTVTGSSGSGTATTTVDITQPALLTISATSPSVLTCAVTSVTSTASVNGGTPGYDIFWSNGDFGATATFFDPGVYTATATDANGCTKVTSVSVSQDISAPTAVAAGGVLDCMVQQVVLDGSGSSQGGIFVYNWSTVNGNIVAGGTTLTPIVNACGTYVLTVTNTFNGCTASTTAEVTCEIDPPDVSVSNAGPLTCAFLEVTLSGNSSVPNVNYTWTGPNGFTSSEQNPTTTVPGDYLLVVENPDNGCSNSAITTVEQNIVAPTDTARVSDTLTCVIDSAEISMSTNITTGYFLWIGPNGFMSTQQKDTIAAPGEYIGIVTDTINGCKTRDTIMVIQNLATPGATATANSSITCINTMVQLTGEPAGPNTFSWVGPNNFQSDEQSPLVDVAGVYILSVTLDSTGCTSVDSVTVLQNTTIPTAAIAAPGNLNCNNATIQLDASGSSQGANFTYLWTTTDGAIESGETSLTPIVSAVGTYTLQVSNGNNGCISEASTTVSESTPVVAIITASDNVSCNGGANGSATAEGSGGNGVYTYKWSNGPTTATVNNLMAGTYTVTITDGEGCKSTTSVIISQPTMLAANAVAVGESALGANDGSATATPSGGTPAYSFAWSNGGITASIIDLAPGTYTVTVEDANACTTVQSVTVNAFGCDISGTVTPTNLTCNGANNGMAEVVLTGSVDPVSYDWSTGDTTALVNDLAAGTYTVSITDGNNCPLVLNVTITQPGIVTPNADATDETSAGANDGTAVADGSGGTAPYTYAWSNGETSAAITGLVPGLYTVSVTDANDCTGTQTVTVNPFNCALSATVTGVNVSCFGGSDGQASIVALGGQLPYSYQWSNGASTQTVNGLAAGTYLVDATDAAGCITTGSVVIAEPLMLVATVVSIQNVLCPSDQTGSANIAAAGGTAPYVFTGDLTNLGVGNHTVMVTDANMCSTSVSFEIMATDTQLPVVSCPATIFLCGADIVDYPAPTATDNCALAGPPVLISGQASGTAFNDGTTVQVFRATDTAGNSKTCSFSIIVYPVPDIFFDGSTNDQNGAGVGSISITPVGGGGGFDFAWNWNGQFFSTEEDLTGLSAGSYTLTITDANGCTSALSPIVINNTVATSEPDGAGTVQLFPNPTVNSFQLNIIDLDVVAASIFDGRGRLVYKLKDNEWNQEVSISQFAPGIYFVRLSTDNGRALLLRFIKSE